MADRLQNNTVLKKCSNNEKWVGMMMMLFDGANSTFVKAAQMRAIGRPPSKLWPFYHKKLQIISTISREGVNTFIPLLFHYVNFGAIFESPIKREQKVEVNDI